MTTATERVTHALTEEQVREAAPRVDQLEEIIAATERNQPNTDAALLHVYGHYDAYWEMAQGLASSKATHHDNPFHVMAIAIYAYEVEIGLMTALRGMYVVNNKLAMETWLMELLAKRLGVKKVVEQSTAELARITLSRPGEEPMTVEFTLAQAIQANLVAKGNDGKLTVVDKKHPWARYPEDMLFWRALSRGLRRFAPDLFGGVYSLEEASDFDYRAQRAQGTPGGPGIEERIRERAGNGANGDGDQDPPSDWRERYEARFTSILEEHAPEGWGEYEVALFQQQRVGKSDRAEWTKDEYTFGGLLLKRGDTAIEYPQGGESKQGEIPLEGGS